MKKITYRKLLTALGFMLIATGTLHAQLPLMSKTTLDSIKPYQFRGVASLGIKLELTDKLNFSISTAADMMYATKHHQFGFTGGINYNLFDHNDTGNKGYFCLKGHLYQFKIDGNKREKTPFYTRVAAVYQYDRTRLLYNRVQAGAEVVWQPLRKHKYLCFEPGIGLSFNYEDWGMFNTQQDLDNYNANAPQWAKDYQNVDPTTGNKIQLDGRVNVSLFLWGEWNIVSFTTYVVMQQPFLPAYWGNKDMEIKLDTEAPQYRVIQNNWCPLVDAGFSLNVRIWKRLALTSSLTLTWDPGEMPVNARNITYLFLQGFSIGW